MQLSKYTLIVNDHPGVGEHLVYNTRTQALLKINQRLRDILDTFDLQQSNKQRFPITEYERHEDELKSLLQMGVLVEDETDEIQRFDRFMEQRKYGVDHSNFTVSILTTYNCNFACTYCFEESTRTSSQRLADVTSDMIMSWLKKKLKKLQVKQLTINYYGGEPLLNLHAIEYISGHMKAWCESRDMDFKMALQTNGALLTPELVDKYILLGLKSARVSVDGIKEVHDRQRPMRGSGEGTFDVVIKNLISAVDKIKISIAAGYDKGDPSGILALLDYLDKIGVLKKLDNFMHSPIHPTLGPKGDEGAIVGTSCMTNYETDTLLSATKTIKDALRDKGFQVGSGLSVAMCPLTRDEGGVTVDTNGLLFKCNSMLGHPELAIGDVREDEYNEKQKEFMATDNWKKCDSDCSYAPICNMGCRLFAFFKTQDWRAKSCEREYMDEFMPRAIKFEYDEQCKIREKKKQTEEILVS
jgi:uncharacterized protein